MPWGRVSASHNTATLKTERIGQNPGVSEHCITFGQTSAGEHTAIHVVGNEIISVGNTILFFQGALDYTGNSIFNCSHNTILTTSGDPSVYFIDQFSLGDRVSFSIDNNRLSRRDASPVTRPYLSLTYDFSVLGYAIFSFSDNECYPQTITSGPELAIITNEKVANVGPTAYFAICNNIYNGNPSDYIINQIMKPYIRGLMNCNVRSPATTPTTTTTTRPATTTVGGDQPQVNDGSALSVAVAAATTMLSAFILNAFT